MPSESGILQPLHSSGEGAFGGGCIHWRAHASTHMHTVEGTSKRLREELRVRAATGDKGECIILLQPETSSITGTLLILLPSITHHSEALDKMMAAGCLLGRQREYVMNEERAGL